MILFRALQLCFQVGGQVAGPIAGLADSMRDIAICFDILGERRHTGAPIASPSGRGGVRFRTELEHEEGNQ